MRDDVKREVHQGNGCKLVFTACFFDVYRKTKAQKDIKENCLKPEESRERFQGVVGEETLGDHPNITRLAERVVEECGLPLALITMGRSSEKKPEEWEHAVGVLRESAGGSTFTGIGLDKEMYDVSKFSYDNLPESTFKSCLLYRKPTLTKMSSLITVLVRGLSLVDECDSIRGRIYGYVIIGFPLDACLLEQADFSGNVKMHDA
ncbi:hypothetical protein SLEP1_g44029 [Rubroshorea leprosula]|uniref:NB-ARC domain-containing protein n=1 Tax=Rubroshorea leprosula TaxID=152421 RepID=A0AAV5LEZ8_9ROSI|nr:hypothetical protein SLEP1_g44029 [Rubroshorea leprosula]